ncbi:MAG: thermonuclease family protein [Candidatus Margulisiibacteriota bacterium]
MSNLTIRSVLGLVFWVLFCPMAMAHVFSGRVVHVSDGDTIVVLQDNRHSTKIRLAAIDCPEKSQPFGRQAQRFTQAFCDGQRVTVTTTKKDRYGRTIGTVQVGSKRLDIALLEAGLAWHYRYFDHDPALDALEQQARAERKGLWSEANPTPPWDYRKARRRR